MAIDPASIAGRGARRLRRAVGRWLGGNADDDPAPPPLHATAGQALLASRVGRPSAFLCRLDRIVMLNGFGFGAQGWHPFSAAIAEMDAAGVLRYADSLLRRYYDGFRPANAAEAIAGFDDAPAFLRGLPAHGYHCSPWSWRTPEQEVRLVESYHGADYREHGVPQVDLRTDGFKHHGPASEVLGEAEFGRLRAIADALRREGYRREHGDVNVYLLRRGTELRFVCRGGIHRVAAAHALGAETIPCQLCPPYLVDVVESADWPQVVAGRWSEPSARRYLDHLFDAPTRDWARSRGLAAAPARPDPATASEGGRS